METGCPIFTLGISASVRKRKGMGRHDARDVPILPTGGGTDGREIKIVLTKRGRRSLPSEQ